MLIVPHFATFLKLCRVLHKVMHHVIRPVVCVSNHQVSLPVILTSLYTALASIPLFSWPVWFGSLCVDWRNNVCSEFWVCCNAFRAQVDSALIHQFWRSTGTHWQSLAQPSGWQLVTIYGCARRLYKKIGARQCKQTMVCPDVSIISAHQAILFNVHLPSLYALHFVKIPKNYH